MHKSLNAAFGLALLWAAPVVAASNTDTYRVLSLFGDIFAKVRSDYVQEVDDNELIESAINGMLAALDPHSSFLNAKAHKEMQVQTRGEFGGLGIEVTMENGLVKVVSPIDDTPAHRAGLQPGDLVSHLNGEQVMGLTLTEAVEKMRGPVDSEITLTILRQGRDQPFDLKLKRAVIRINPVRARAEGNVIYLRVTTFSEQSNDAMRAAYNRIKGQIGNGVEGVVLDLRNNPGGLLDQAIAISDSFLTGGEIVSTRGRKKDDIQRHNAKDGDIAEGKPIVVLINGGSASASEIVAGALQDHRRAVVLGTKSFGKGSVQTVIPLGRQGALRLTTARYYTPSGRSIQAQGIEPDIVVEPARIESLAARGPQRSESSLRGHLANPDGKDEKPANGPAAAPSNGEAPAPQPQAGAAQDYQLARALDLIRGLKLFGNRAAN
ncbi:MAG: S41 family peptidase [Alphaproteobacteria bacterium]|nr:S41 family peptidase [Alphaproteobacteria bacterium]